MICYGSITIADHFLQYGFFCIAYAIFHTGIITLRIYIIKKISRNPLSAKQARSEERRVGKEC